MIVRKIALQGWRNYEFAAAEFSPGTNVITGENAQGKTNLLEAVYLLTGGKSFRTRFDKELIGFGYTGAEVLADVFAFGREQTVRIVLRQGQRKQIWQKLTRGDFPIQVTLAVSNLIYIEKKGFSQKALNAATGRPPAAA